jgi:hypothetical protein
VFRGSKSSIDSISIHQRILLTTEGTEHTEGETRKRAKDVRLLEHSELSLISNSIFRVRIFPCGPCGPCFKIFNWPTGQQILLTTEGTEHTEGETRKRAKDVRLLEHSELSLISNSIFRVRIFPCGPWFKIFNWPTGQKILLTTEGTEHTEGESRKRAKRCSIA